eukprot:TRINITY_DN27990_c0_g1_i1.p1 TRINITY_DN27990_c0_g1~~TRINITY_DN27990_c0_g1_i1.p1  ORF type:complete len:538 (+),score=105.32 TRINITY_DN27990_c0_g1_i1:56-1669(+)
MNRCLLILLAARYVWSAGTKGGEKFTATFQPGKLGISADFAAGRVQAVHEGQAKRAGVDGGMVMLEVDGEKYTEALLDKRIAGNKAYTVTFRRPAPAPPPPAPPGDVPAKPDFKFAVELTADTFKANVLDVTNGSSTGASKEAPYFPVVMFHVSWCKHCRHALPELEKAAQTVEEQLQSGQLNRNALEAVPKFFVFECDANSEHKSVCKDYTESTYPLILLFRNQRAMRFNRPRTASVFSWWASSMSRVPYFRVFNKDDPAKMTERGSVFVLIADEAHHEEEIRSWKEVALDFMEEHTFALASPELQLQTASTSFPALMAQGSGLEPVNFRGDRMTHATMADWVNFNQFEAPVTVSYYTGHQLASSGLPIVCLSYSSESPNSNVKSEFETKARKLRKHHRLVFATADVAQEEVQIWMKNTFPLLQREFSPPPRVFIFSGDTYWETHIDDAKELNADTIKEIMTTNKTIIQRGTAFGQASEKGKLYVRYATRSPANLAAAVGVPFAALAVACCCLKELCGSEASKEPSDSNVSKGKVD